MLTLPEVRFRLRLSESELASWAENYNKQDDSRVEEIGARARRRGHLWKSELAELAKWKSPRIGGRIDGNPGSVVAKVTRLAFEMDDPSLAIRALQLLDGVGWPMSSVILHFCSSKPYPVIDVRVLWSVGFDKLPTYTPNFWVQYTQFCRGLAERTGLNMRDVDRGLWQYAKESGKMASSNPGVA